MKDRDKWMRLCEQASREQDPKKIIALTAEIIRLLRVIIEGKVGRAIRADRTKCQCFNPT